MSKQGEECHKEIDGVINKMKNEIHEIKVSHRDILKKHLKQITQIESSIKENLHSLKDLQRESNIVSAIMEYKLKNNELSMLPPQVQVSLPTFCPKPIDRGEVYELIGSIKPLTATTHDEHGYTWKRQRRPCRELLHSPEVIKTFNTGYTNLRKVSFYSEQDILAYAAGVNEIKCFNANSINAIKTKSGEDPNDIAVTRDGCLLFCDWELKTVNKVVNSQIEEIIILQGWIPCNLCVKSSGDLLVVMCDEAKTENKVVRYAGSVETQTIQYEKEGKPLYSSDYKIKNIAENRNLDICVADRAAGTVVVVNQAGKLRFRYTGHSFKSKVNPFLPRGITTNNQSQILVSDFGNICIQILDQDGQFLRYIDGINEPSGLCVDTLDNLFVAENKTGDVKVIKYLQ